MILKLVPELDEKALEAVAARITARIQSACGVPQPQAAAAEPFGTAGPLLLELPDYMDETVNGHAAQHLSLIGRAWVTVFPGLEARLDGDEDGKAAIAFRLAGGTQ